MPRHHGEANSSWASLFGSTSGKPMAYTPPTSVGDKIVVTPTEEIERSLIKELGYERTP